MKIWPVLNRILYSKTKSRETTIQHKKKMFRPCIDIHDGEVKQIVGASLTTSEDKIETNFKSERPSTYFAEMYKVRLSFLVERFLAVT